MRRTSSSTSALLAALVSLGSLGSLGLAGGTAHAQTTLRIATLAPDGSSWMKLFNEWKKNVEAKSNGQIKIKIFSGGVQGDERDAIRKMKIGQLSGGAVTAIGLGLINPEVRLLELPRFFKTDAEVDFVRDTLAEELEKKFLDKGYVLLAWGDVGWVHLFSNIPIKSRKDIGETKMWAWVDDPLVRALFAKLNVTGVPLGVPDVLPSLQTGLINACYGPPLATLALQWITKVKYMTSVPLSMGVGATVVTKAEFDKLSPELQKVLRDESKALQAHSLQVVRADNQRAINAMKAKYGLEIVDAPKELVEDLEAQSRQVWEELAGKMYSKEFLERVKKLVADFRAKGGK
jgi:TRAP-type C4-dicarboxylate transport system substrate-binding protein